MEHNPLSDLHQYAPNMTIQSLKKFFKKKNINITRSMLQNYVRLGIVPASIDKKFYTHKHIAILYLIYRLKAVFDLETIKKALLPLMNEEGLSDDIYQQIITPATGMTDSVIKNMLFVAELQRECVEGL